MSEHHNIEGCASNDKDNGINSATTGVMENETNEFSEFEEETLQITDVHVLEHTVGDYPVHGTTELSSTSRLWTSNQSPASIEKFLDPIAGIETTPHKDLQSEFAALGLNSLYPSDGQDEESSFDVTFERSITLNDPNIVYSESIKNTRENSLPVPLTPNSTESNFKLLEDLQEEDFIVSFNNCGETVLEENSEENTYSTNSSINEIEPVAHEKDGDVEMSGKLQSDSDNSVEITYSTNYSMNEIKQIAHGKDGDVDMSGKLQGENDNSIAITYSTNSSINVMKSVADGEDGDVDMSGKLQRDSGNSIETTYSTNSSMNETKPVAHGKDEDVEMIGKRGESDDSNSSTKEDEPVTHKKDDVVEVCGKSPCECDHSGETTDSTSSAMNEFIPVIHQKDDDFEISESDGSNDNRIIVHPSQSNSPEESLSGGKVCLNSININEESIIGNKKEKQNPTLNLSAQNCSGITSVAYISDVQSNLDHSDFLNEEYDDVFVDAVDSFILSEIGSYSDENKMTPLTISKTNDGHNCVSKPETMDGNQSENLNGQQSSQGPQQSFHQENEVNCSINDNCFNECSSPKKISSFDCQEIKMLREETCQVKLCNSKEIAGDPLKVDILQFEEAVDKIYEVEPLGLDEVLKEIHQNYNFVEESLEEAEGTKLSLTNEINKEKHNVELSSSELVPKVIYTAVQTTSEDVDKIFVHKSTICDGDGKEIHEMETSSLKETNRETPQLLLVRNNESVVDFTAEENFQLEPSGLNETTEETCEFKLYKPEDDKETQERVASRSDRVVNNPCTLEPSITDKTQKIELNRLEMSKEVQEEQCNFYEVVKETHTIEVSEFEENKGHYQSELPRYVDAVQATLLSESLSMCKVVGDSHEIEQSGLIGETQNMESRKSENYFAVDTLQSQGVDNESYPLEQCKNNKVAEGIHELELSKISGGTNEVDLTTSQGVENDSYPLEQCKNNEIAEVIDELELSRLSGGTNEVFISKHKNVDEEKYQVAMSMSEEVVNKGVRSNLCRFDEDNDQTLQVEVSRSGKSIKGTQLEISRLEDVEDNFEAKLFELELLVNESQIMPQDEFLEETLEPVNTVEVYEGENQMEISGLNKLFKESHAMENTVLEEDVKEVQNGQTSGCEKVIPEIKLIKMSRSEEIDEVISEMELYPLKEVAETLEIRTKKESTPGGVAEKTHKVSLSGSEEVFHGTQQIEQFIPKEFTQEATELEENTEKEDQIFQSHDTFEATSRMEPSRYNSSVEEILQVKLSSPKIVVEEMCEDLPSRPAEVQDLHTNFTSGSIRIAKDTDTMVKANSENVSEEACEMGLLLNEKLDETQPVELSMFEEFTQSKDKMTKTRVEEIFREPITNVKCSKDEVSKFSSSFTGEQANIHSNFGPDASFFSLHSNQAQDMSLTIVDEPTNNLNTSKVESSITNEICLSTSNHLSQTLVGVLDNVDIKDTNDFTTHSDQKMYDTLYIPLPENIENNTSLSDNGLQSFMEITMANTNVAMIEQNLNNTSKLDESIQSQKLHQRTEFSTKSNYIESSPLSSENEDIVSSFNSNSSNSGSDLEHIINKNHEMMQQSMCDYVTNLSLKLAIPDLENFIDINHADEETRKKCEEQTEGVLLMEWPAQYHDNLKTLKQQNQLLSDCSNQKDTCINNLKKDNDDLLKKVSEVIAKSDEINQENVILKNMLKKSSEDKGLISVLEHENKQLLKDLEALRGIESEFSNFKIRNDEIILAIANERLAKEEEIKVLKDKIEELEHDLLKIGQTANIVQSQNEEIHKLEESIHIKESQIEKLKQDNILLEEKVSCLSTHLETIDELKQNNDYFKEALEIEKEKSKDIEDLKIILKKQNDDFSVQNEKLSKLVIDLNEKEKQIQDLVENKVNLEETVVSLNKQLYELRKIEEENLQLNCDLQEEHKKREEMQVLSKLLEEQISLQVENVSKLNNEISEKDYQIETLMNCKTDLKDIIETLNKRLEELKEFEMENKQLKITIMQEDEKLTEIKSLKSSLEDQVINLNAQNELLWNELKVSSTKEQSLYALKEERLLLEEKLAQMKREIQEINNLKSDNEHLVDELSKRDCEIRNLTADKKKLKSSLMKANDKLNERDAEIERLSETLQYLDEQIYTLNEEKSVLQNNLDQSTSKVQELKEELKCDRLILTEDIGNVSEYLSSVIYENLYLAEDIVVLKEGNQKLTGEIVSFKNKILEEKFLFDEIKSEKEGLLKTVDRLKESLLLVTDELNHYKNHFNEAILLKEENDALLLKVNSLDEKVSEYEDEKNVILGDMSSLSETISNLLIDRQLLSEQLKLNSEMRESTVLLKDEKCQLEQQVVRFEHNNTLLTQSNSMLQTQLESVKDKDIAIEELEDLVRGLENHLCSMNEELLSEMSKNDFLTLTIDELKSNLSQNNERMLEFQNTISSLMDQLNKSGEKNNYILGLEQLIKDLELHISSLNEELMSEITKSHFLSVENNTLECQQSKTVEEKLLLEKLVSCAEETLKNRLKNNDKKLISLHTCINEILQENSNFECENLKLNKEISNVQMMLEISNQSILDLANTKQSLELKLNTITEQKIELENKLTTALAQESCIRLLEQDNESLLKVAEAHRHCEDTTKLLQNEKSGLEGQIQTLAASIEELRSEQHLSDNQIKENLQLKEIMTKEVHSLTGEVWDSKAEPLIEVYHKLMKEFLNKEQEVIFSLQNNCESKIESSKVEIFGLKNELDEKKVLTSKLENEVEDCKMKLNHCNTLISGLETELLTVKSEISSHISEIENIKLHAENEKESLISTVHSLQQVEIKLEEKISILNHEINCKNNKIIQLEIDLERIKCEKTDLLMCREENFRLVEDKKNLVDEMTSSLNNKQEIISQLNLELQNKNNEVSQLTDSLEKKEIEIGQYLMKNEEMGQVIMKLNTIENDIEIINNFLTSHEKYDGESFVDSLQTCQVLGDLMKLAFSKFTKILNELQVSNDNLRLEHSEQVEVCKSLRTQINDMNEELKSNKLLYDEDSLQFKEEIASKNVTIANLTEALEKFKSYASKEAESAEVKNMEEELHKLREENQKLLNESSKIPYLTIENRKLSWEIEDLSRSIKFEKQSNIDLKVKCDHATNQVTDLSKKNFHLEDKIDALESKLKNYDVLSSLKIVFPLGISTVDMQVKYLNEKLAEFDQINTRLSNLIDEHTVLKLEHDKSKEYIKRQEEKLSKIMKRELELKKQIATNMQKSPDTKTLKGLKTDLLSLFPGQNISLPEAFLNIKSLVEKQNIGGDINKTEIDDLNKKVNELSQENKDLDAECEMMNKHIKEQEELLASLFKREEELKKLNAELKSQLLNPVDTESSAIDNDVKELFGIFPEKPLSLRDSINLIKIMLTENQNLKEKVTETQEEYASLDKECEDMFKAYQIKEKDLADVLKKEDLMKDKQQILENEMKTMLEELQEVRSQLAAKNNSVNVPASCQCEELKSRLSKIKVDLAERSAKITALELQFEADNFPLKKKVADLEKSLDQAKQKVNELKSEVRRYQDQMCDVTVGLRAECERCRTMGTSADPTSTAAITALQQQLQEKSKEINILKALCKTRNQKIKELEERDSSYKITRSQRSALKEVNENKAVPQSPTNPSKSSLQ